MGAYATLTPLQIIVEPGGEDYCEVKVRNAGSVVDQFTFEVIAGNDRPEWIVADPPSLSLFPQEEGTVRVYFRPPRHAALTAGPVPFAVKVISQEDPEGSVVEEGTVEIGRLLEVAADITPRSKAARRSATYKLSLDNYGNFPANAAVSASDPNETLRFRFAPAMTADAGTRATSKLKVRPKDRMWRGQPKLHPFRVSIEPEGAAPVTVDAQLLQQAIIPRWAVWTVVALAGLVILWFAALQPTIESAAKTGAERERRKAESAADLAQAAAGEAATAEEGAAASADEAEKAVGKAGSAASKQEGQPTEGRLLVEAAPAGSDGEVGAAERSTFGPVPDRRTLAVTDIVMENPEGDSGVLTLLRVAADGETETTLLRVALENFRSLDYHFVSPLFFSAGDRIALSVECREGGSPVTASPPAEPEDCSNVAVYFTGFLEQQKKPKKE